MRKKRFLTAMACAAALLALTASVCFAEDVSNINLNETFEGSFTTSGNTVTGGQIKETASTSSSYSTFTIETDSSGNKYLKDMLIAPDNGRNGAQSIYLRASKAVAAQRYAVAEMDIMIKQITNNSVGARIQVFKNASSISQSNCLAAVSVYNQYLYIYSNYSLNNVAAMLKYSDYGIADFDKTKDDWKNVKFIFDSYSGQYDVIIDGTLIAVDIPSYYFHNDSGTNLYDIGYNTIATAATNYTGIDNVKLYSVTAEYANSLTEAGLNKLIGTPDISKNNTVTLPYSGLLGDKIGTSGSTPTTTHYSYALSDTSSASISRSDYDTENSKAGEKSYVEVTLPQTPFDSSVNTNLDITITRHETNGTEVTTTATYNLRADVPALTFKDVTGTPASGVTKDLLLPNSYAGHDISWSSSNSELIDVNSGKVRQRNKPEKVTLTAVFSESGTTKLTKTFPVTILADGKIYLQEYFEPLREEELTNNSSLGENDEMTLGGKNVKYWNSWYQYDMSSSYSENVTAVIKPDPENADNMVCEHTRLRSSGGSIQSICRNLGEVKTGKITVSSKLYIDELGDNERFDVSLRQDTTVAKKVIQLSFLGKGKIINRQVQTAGDSESSTQYSDDSIFNQKTWFDIRIEIDTEARAFDLYIDNNKINSEPWGFYCATEEVKEARSTPDEIKIIDFDLFRTNSESRVYYDDVIIYEPDKNAFEVVEMDANSVTLFDKSGESAKACAYVAAYDNQDRLSAAEELDISDFNGKYVETFGFSSAMPQENKRLFIWTKDGLNPMMEQYDGTEESGRPTRVYIAGDSTAHTYEYPREYPQTGWGQLLGNYFNTENIEVHNAAMGGRSTRSFIDQGLFDDILYNIRPGDYLLVQFGHNDNKTDVQSGTISDRYTDSETTYHDWLAVYANEARKKGAIPIFITSISRLDSYDNNTDTEKTDSYTYGSSLESYPEEMMKAAQELGVDTVDMFTQSVQHLQSLSYEDARKIYLMIDTNDPRYIDDPNFVGSKYNSGSQNRDATHFNTYGANVWADMIAKSLKNQIGGAFAAGYIDNK